ncbi:MAG: type II toxin-antitoxin system RelE/ParE family toxin [Chryseobacterium sp.]|nr:type II toxin-antitoxin system RelE/ParE family toxin [Chryseobacterium sp.]
MYELEIQEEANLEILETYIYYENIQTGLGERFLKQIEIYLVKIRDNPKHFQIKGIRYREAYIYKFPYLIIFDIVDDKIIILSVFNTHQNPTKSLKL